MVSIDGCGRSVVAARGARLTPITAEQLQTIFRESGVFEHMQAKADYSLLHSSSSDAASWHAELGALVLSSFPSRLQRSYFGSGLETTNKTIQIYVYNI